MKEAPDKIITFPHMANYYIPIEIFLKSVFEDCKVLVPKPITKKTLDLGSKYSPDFVCVPFKYNLGNFIESLEQGANVLIQAGGGCRYGYYGEVQEQILKDLGYEFQFISLFNDGVNLITSYNTCKRLGSKVSFYKFAHDILLTIKMVNVIDEIESYVRENIGFELHKNSFDKMHNEFLNDLKTVKTMHSLKKVHNEYSEKFKKIKVKNNSEGLKVGLVGELYTLMEPFSNYFIEKELAKYNISVRRFTTLTYLLFEKSKYRKKTLKGAGKYLKYAIGADGTESVSHGKMLAEDGFDGIIHVKPFGCTPEVNAMPMLQNLGNDYKIPILYFSFDSQTSETGIKTRLEAFNDMLVMKNQKKIYYQR